MPDRPRGAHLLDAALTVLAEDGYGALSIRSVAAAAGVSPAQVQYYFRTKRDLVAAAFEHAGTAFLDDLRAVLDDEPSAARLRRVLHRWLPLDEARERRAKVWLGYAATAAVDPDLAAESATLDAELRGWLTAELTTLRVPAAEAAAAQLLAMVDGVTTQTLALPMADRAALVAATVDAYVDQLVP
jgi:AcrR family transcriptional regulator